jgi:tetratricopeptide (TPR) repeat protein
LEYVDKELPEALSQKVGTHLSGCVACRNLASQLRAEAEAGDLIKPVSAPGNFAAQVMSRLQTVEARRPARRTSRPLSLYRAGWAAAAFALIALALGYFVSLPPASIDTTGRTERVESQQQAVETAESQQTVPSVEKPVVAQVPVKEQPRQTVVAEAPQPAASEETELTTDEWLETAAYEEEEGNLDEALAAYEAAAEEPQAREVALLGIGRVYEKMGLMAAAIEAYDEALMTSSEDYSSNGRIEG